MVKKIGMLLLAAFLAFRSYELVNSLLLSGTKNLSLALSLLVSFLLVLFVTGIFAFPGFVFPTSRILPAAYYRIRYPEVLRRIARWLGVDYFRRLLLVAFWGKKRQRKKYFDGTKGGMANLDYQTRQSEFGHLVPFFLLLFISFRLLMEGYLLVFIGIVVLNILANGYPILLQRVHRMRTQALYKRIG